MWSQNSETMVMIWKYNKNIFMLFKFNQNYSKTVSDEIFISWSAVYFHGGTVNLLCIHYTNSKLYISKFHIIHFLKSLISN